jgi:predicted glutamine amidotransferase
MPVAEANCHPFQHGPYLFMHNGHLGSFRNVRRTLLAGLCEEAFELVTGGTDSEHLFAIFIDELIGANTEEPLAMAMCLNRAVWRALALVKDLGGQHPSFLNLAVCDGHRVAACRFTDDPTHAPESLYLIKRGLYDPVAQGSPARRQHEDSTSFVVSSERLTDDPLWRSIEPNHLVSLARDGAFSVFRMDPDGLVPTDAPTQATGATL